MNTDRHGATYARVRDRVTGDLPSATGDVDSLLAVAGADKPRSLGQLDRYLASRPDALFTTDAACPAVAARLARVLHEAGYPVTPPGCGRCARRVPLRHQRPEGRVCDDCARQDRRRPCAHCGQLALRIAARRPEGPVCQRCHRKDPQTFEACAKCRRVTRMAARRADGTGLCQRCAPRPARTCAQCGTLAPAHAKTPAGPVCKRCYQRSHQPMRICGGCRQFRPVARRGCGSNPDLCADCVPAVDGTCVVCGRLRPGHLSRAGGFYCNSCRTGTARRCVFCGQVRPVKVNWPAGPGCSTCHTRVRENPGQCAGCSQIRVLIGVDQAGGPICGPCAGASVDYLCGSCGQAGRVYEAGRCFSCLVADRLRDMLGGATGQIPTQLQPLATALMAAEKPRSVMVWLRRSSAAQLLTRLAAQDQPITHELLDALPVNQDVHYVRQILVHTEILPQRLEYLDRLQPWLEQTLEARPDAHTRLARPYANWYLLHRARRRARRRGDFTTFAAARIRSEIRVALDLLDQLDRDGLTIAALRQHHIDRWVAAGPPSRYSIRYFLAWATERGLVGDVTVPARKPAPPSVFVEQDEQMRQLERCLGDERLPLDVRVAGALILLFGINTSRVLSLRRDQVTERGGETYLTLDQHELIIPPRLAKLLTQLPRRIGRSTLPPNPTAPQLLFPARITSQPVAAGPFSGRLKKHGITVRGGRNTALIGLAADLPAPVLAGLLDLHIGTGVRWTKYAKRDWESYLADRRAARRRT